MCAPTGLVTPVPRLVRGLFCAAGALASDGGASGAISYSVTGNLTMHGVTRPVTLAVTAPPPFNHAGGIRRGIEATTSVNRKDFGLLWEFPGEGAGVVVGDTIQITIDAELRIESAERP